MHVFKQGVERLPYREAAADSPSPRTRATGLAWRCPACFKKHDLKIPAARLFWRFSHHRPHRQRHHWLTGSRLRSGVFEKSEPAPNGDGTLK